MDLCLKLQVKIYVIPILINHRKEEAYEKENIKYISSNFNYWSNI